MTEARRRLGLRDLFTDGRVALMLPLGFSSGLPFLLVFSTLSAWLREAGISRTEIGMLSWVALAYSLKFLWAPIVDRYDVPGAGARCSGAGAAGWCWRNSRRPSGWWVSRSATPRPASVSPSRRRFWSLSRPRRRTWSSTAGASTQPPPTGRA